MRLIIELSVLAGLMLLIVALQLATGLAHWRVPWYLLMQPVLGIFPLVWLGRKVLPGEERPSRLAVAATSAAFIALSTSCELQAIHHRYWWFTEAVDPLSGLRIGAVPAEEFLFYAVFLNLPMLIYLRLKHHMAPTPPRQPLSATARRIFQVLGTLLALTGVVLIGLAIFHTSPPLDVSLVPSLDAAGAFRYSTGPAQHGWTIVQTLALASICFWYPRLAERIDHRRLALSTAIFFVFALYLELMGCGRGWWVWNEQQVIGIFNWVLPIDSYSMYFTGATMPVIVYEWLRGAFAEAPAAIAAPTAPLES